MIDSKRISHLVDYFSNESKYLVAALLPEDSAAVNDSSPEATLKKIGPKIE